jgi:hypothetical protein
MTGAPPDARSATAASARREGLVAAAATATCAICVSSGPPRVATKVMGMPRSWAACGMTATRTWHVKLRPRIGRSCRAVFRFDAVLAEQGTKALDLMA